MTTTENLSILNRLTDSSRKVREQEQRLQSVRNAICCYDLAYPALMRTEVRTHDINLSADGSAHAAISLKGRQIGVWASPAGAGRTALTIGEKPEGLGVVGQTLLVDTSNTRQVQQTVRKLNALASSRLLDALKTPAKEQE